MRSTPVRRPSLPLTTDDERDLAQLRASKQQLQALARMSGHPEAAGDASESVVLHALFTVGLAAVRSVLEERGYAELAKMQEGESQQRRAEARRRTPTWSDEA